MNNQAQTADHLLLIWPKSVSQYDTILKEISSAFDVIGTWQTSLPLNNILWLKRFYARSLVHYGPIQLNRILTEKLRQTGNGQAFVVTLKAKRPLYDLIQTTNGISYVHTDSLAVKNKIRNLIHSDIHLSDSPIDFNDNQYHLKPFIHAEQFTRVTDIIHNSISDLFTFLHQQHISYVSLRGHEYVGKNETMLHRHKKDIDLLVDKESLNILKTYPFLTNLPHEKKERHTLIYTDGQTHHSCKIDIYPTQSGVLPPDFEQKIITERVAHSDIYTISKENQDLYNLYHYTFQKRYIPQDKSWNNTDFADIVTKTPNDILAFLREHNLHRVLPNSFYPTWNTFPGVTSLDRKPIHRALQTIFNDTYYYTYIFENQNGEIEKEGHINTIKNGYAILRELEHDLPDTIPTALGLYTDETNHFGMIRMSKVAGTSFLHLTNKTWDFATFKKHVLSGLHTLSVFKKHHILHRDINPANLFYTDDKIIFIDFGWSVFEDRENIVGTPEGLNSGFYLDPKGHNDTYSLMQCFLTKYIFPPFLKKILTSYDPAYIEDCINTLSLPKRLTTDLFLRNQRFLHILLHIRFIFHRLQDKIRKQ